jgi:hypothetical protein
MESWFLQSESNDTLYVRIQVKNLIILVMYVDDFLIIDNNNDHIFQVKKELLTGFEIKIWDYFTTILDLKLCKEKEAYLFLKLSMFMNY